MSNASSPAKSPTEQQLREIMVELLVALEGMEIAIEEIAVEFIEHRRATNWRTVNDAYIAAALAIRKAEGLLTENEQASAANTLPEAT